MRWLITAVTAVVCVSVACAQEATTRPADLSSPRSALKAFVEALKSGDAEQAKKICHVTNENDQKVFEAGVKFEAALEKLVTAVEAKFGEGAGVPLREKLGNAGPANVVPMMEKSIPEAPDSSSEDRVTVSSPNQNEGDTKLIRVDGDWKIDVTAMIADMDQQQRQQMLKQMPPATKKLREAAEAVAAGKISSVDDLMAAMK